MITKIVTWIAIYIMIWWISFFATLPLAGHRSQHEAGEATIKGNDPGAPVSLNLWKAVKLNSLVAAGIWLLVILLVLFVRIPLPDIS